MHGDFTGECTARYKRILSDNGPSGQAVKRTQPVNYLTWDTKPIIQVIYMCAKSTGIQFNKCNEIGAFTIY